ncbi:zinc finger protein 703-like [Diadema antillarum]|uniref:zinc finger protein 703-like n=1 Tax=Diadema antillarum TaxID=105358 RepID=UPI003A8C2C63
MLATRTQPLMHTEYLQPMDPLPTTLDAKKSPLALLAQTCSSIGKPDPPPSSSEAKTALTAPLDIGGKKSPEKAATTVSDLDRLSSFKPYKQNEKREGDAHVTKIASYPSSDKVASRGSPLSVITSADSKPIASATTFTSSPASPVKARTESSRPSSNQSSTETVSSHTSTGHSLGCTSSGAHSPSQRGDSKPHAQVSSAPILPTHLVPPALATGYKPSTSLASTPPTSGHCGCPSQLLGHLSHLADPANLSKDHAGHLLAATAGSPYATAYARVKTADGGTTLMPICRDPYCTHCQTASLAAGACTQCRHDGLTLGGAVPFALPVPGAIPAYFPSGSPTAAATPYFYPPPPVPAQTEHGHVCNWVSGNTSCGKRFGSGEELLQHLRTHTMQSSEASVVSASPYTLAASTLNAQLSAYYMHYPAAAPIAGSLGLTKPGVPPSPLSPGSALRYHPYKSPVPSSLATLPGLPAGAYYPPYALHDLKGRLAAAGVPH